MTEKQLLQAKEIQEEITTLNNFLNLLKEGRRGTIVTTTKQHVLKIFFGCIPDEELKISNEIRKILIDSLEKRIEELIIQFKNI